MVGNIYHVFWGCTAHLSFQKPGLHIIHITSSKQLEIWCLALLPHSMNVLDSAAWTSAYSAWVVCGHFPRYSSKTCRLVELVILNCKYDWLPVSGIDSKPLQPSTGYTLERMDKWKLERLESLLGWRAGSFIVYQGFFVLPLTCVTGLT